MHKLKAITSRGLWQIWIAFHIFFYCSSVKKGTGKKTSKSVVLSRCCDGTLTGFTLGCMLNMWLNLLEVVDWVFEISFGNPELLPARSVHCCRLDSLINHLLPEPQRALADTKACWNVNSLSVAGGKKTTTSKNIPHVRREGSIKWKFPLCHCACGMPWIASTPLSRHGNLESRVMCMNRNVLNCAYPACAAKVSEISYHMNNGHLVSLCAAQTSKGLPKPKWHDRLIEGYPLGYSVLSW